MTPQPESNIQPTTPSLPPSLPLPSPPLSTAWSAARRLHPHVRQQRPQRLGRGPLRPAPHQIGQDGRRPAVPTQGAHHRRMPRRPATGTAKKGATRGGLHGLKVPGLDGPLSLRPLRAARIISAVSLLFPLPVLCVRTRVSRRWCSTRPPACTRRSPGCPTPWCSGPATSVHTPGQEPEPFFAHHHLHPWIKILIKKLWSIQ